MSDKIRQYPQNPKAVYYFGTCLAETFYPGAGLAGIKLLQREGVRVIFPPDQTCCGQPAYNAGFWWEARDVAREQIKMNISGPWRTGSCRWKAGI